MDIEFWIEEFLGGLLKRIALDLSIEEFSSDDEGALQVNLDGPDSAIAIGRDGQMLDALQQITIASAMLYPWYPIRATTQFWPADFSLRLSAL